MLSGVNFKGTKGIKRESSPTSTVVAESNLSVSEVAQAFLKLPEALILTLIHLMKRLMDEKAAAVEDIFNGNVYFQRFHLLHPIVELV